MTLSGKIPGFMSSLANLTFPEVRVERGRRRAGAIRWDRCCQQTVPWFSVQTISVHFVLWIQQHSSAYFFFIWLYPQTIFRDKCQVSPYNHLNYLHDDNNRLHVEESQSGAHPGLLRPLQLGGGVRIILIITTNIRGALLYMGRKLEIQLAPYLIPFLLHSGFQNSFCFFFSSMDQQ